MRSRGGGRFSVGEARAEGKAFALEFELISVLSRSSAHKSNGQRPGEIRTWEVSAKPAAQSCSTRPRAFSALPGHWSRLVPTTRQPFCQMARFSCWAVHTLRQLAAAVLPPL